MFGTKEASDRSTLSESSLARASRRRWSPTLISSQPREGCCSASLVMRGLKEHSGVRSFRCVVAAATAALRVLQSPLVSAQALAARIRRRSANFLDSRSSSGRSWGAWKFSRSCSRRRRPSSASFCRCRNRRKEPSVESLQSRLFLPIDEVDRFAQSCAAPAPERPDWLPRQLWSTSAASPRGSASCPASCSVRGSDGRLSLAKTFWRT
mmetsp:Transcript_6170/g.17376  ORF Transcript_6170/g.17376 Transcript_6170/m.17376 type:complete len:209 (-) Transcript_6170:501-1127(-)